MRSALYNAEGAPHLWGIARQPVQVFHVYPAVRTAYAHPFEFERDAKTTRAQIPRLHHAPVIDRTALTATARTGAGLFLRRSGTTRKSGSPNTPLSFAAARNPGNEYSSHQVRARFIDGSFHRGVKNHEIPYTDAA